MGSAITEMVCGCPADHLDECALGQAETIATEALDTAAANTHPLTAALIALTEAGMLSTTIADEGTIHDILMGLLDDLYEADLLGPVEQAPPASPASDIVRTAEVEHAEAASGLSDRPDPAPPQTFVHPELGLRRQS